MGTMTVKQVLDFARIGYRALDQVNNLRLNRACRPFELNDESDNSFIQDLVNLSYLYVSHYARRKGYISVKYDDKYIETYNGKYGLGFIIAYPNRRSVSGHSSNRFHDIVYVVVYSKTYVK